MKVFLVVFVTALLFINGSLAGTGADQMCNAAVIDTRDLSPWILRELEEKRESLKGMPTEEIDPIMDNLVEELLTRENLTPRDIDILQGLLCDVFGPKGEIRITIKW